MNSLYLQKALLPVLILFHAIGFVGMVFIDMDYFASLSMYNLLFSLLLIFIAQQKDKNLFVQLFVPVFILGYTIELIGIKTGFPFGSYYYGQALGVQLFDVPLVIGVNWFMLVLGSGFLVKRWVGAPWAQVLLASLIMVFVDYPIEQVASKLDYWQWEDNHIPLQNFVGWFVIALCMQLLFQRIMRNSENKLAPSYLVVLVVFFLALNMFL